MKYGALTQDKIKVLCKYYAKAIWSNETVEDMRAAVWASLFHCYPTDANPQHMFCSKGPNSW